MRLVACSNCHTQYDVTDVADAADGADPYDFDLHLIFDWSVNDYLLMSFVGAVLVPLKGGEEFFGSDEPWGQVMIYWSVKL